MNPTLLIDFYKVGHVSQYPPDTEYVYSNWTPRYTHRPGACEMVHFGLRYFMEHYLRDYFWYEFFSKPWYGLERDYTKLIQATLGVEKPKTDHLEALHRLNRIPLKIYSLPEGTSVPLGVPAMVIVNTRPEFFWLPNYIETLMSNVLWMPSTSASIAKEYRKVFYSASVAFGNKDHSFIDWMGHDFSYRGMSGTESAALSGMGHLLSFNGTDTIPAILYAYQYYDAALGCGGSVPATEHSVMCAGGKENEFETFKRLITEIYPTGIVSIVSDTWDLWKVIDDILPRLRDHIQQRQGKIVVRPDSGDPVKVSLRAAELLKEKFGVNDAGMLANGKLGLIYGDSITLDRARAICAGLVDLKINPFNMVFGIGSYTYQYNTRDTFGLAMKATAVQRAGTLQAIYKDPVTDNGGKKSARGIPIVYEQGGKLVLVESLNPRDLDNCEYDLVFEDGQIKESQSFEEIRRRVRI
jgi:nicotinamide phosphoribosyltransferase